MLKQETMIRSAYLFMLLAQIAVLGCGGAREMAQAPDEARETSTDDRAFPPDDDLPPEEGGPMEDGPEEGSAPPPVVPEGNGSGNATTVLPEIVRLPEVVDPPVASVDRERLPAKMGVIPRPQFQLSPPNSLLPPAAEPEAAPTLRHSAARDSAAGPAGAIPEMAMKNSSNPSAPTATPTRAESAAAPSIPDETASEADVVPVFYATDRLPLDLAEGISLWGAFLPSMAAGLVTLLLAAATVFLNRRILCGSLTVIAALITVLFVHSTMVEHDKDQRWLDNGSRVYGNERHEDSNGYQFEMGVCEVSIPPDHQLSRMERPSVFRLEFHEDPEKHLVLGRITVQSTETFYRQLTTRIDGSPEKQAFVFVHGYNVSFENAVKRTAQIAHDLNFNGAPICYSWPSQAGLAQYTRDEANADWTVMHLEEFLDQVVARTHARSIHLLAHSMGNRALLPALERIALKQPDPKPLFGQLIMAAPDVDTSQFRDRYVPAARRIVRQLTLYASSNDQALAASTKVHGHTRAGLSGNDLVVVPGVDTVDVSHIDTSLIGHSYYGDNPQLIRDLRALVELKVPPSNRPWLERIVNSSDYAYWIFRERVSIVPENARTEPAAPQGTRR